MTIPATSPAKHSQNIQHIHVRCRFFLRCDSSHESLFEGSDDIWVQNLKRDWGRPEKPSVSCEALQWMVKECVGAGLRGMGGAGFTSREGWRVGFGGVGVVGDLRSSVLEMVVGENGSGCGVAVAGDRGDWESGDVLGELGAGGDETYECLSSGL